MILTKTSIKVNIIREIILILLYFSYLGAYNGAGELFVAPVCPTHGEKHLESVSKLLREKGIRTIIFMAGTRELQRQALERLEAAAGHPLMVLQDGEWGLGMRLGDYPKLPKNRELAARGSDLKAFGLLVAGQCREMGVHCPLAPVVDVNSNPLNPVIGDRSFGDDPEVVASCAVQMIEGLHAGGVMACAKHFPGHGDTQVDSHIDLPLISKSLEEMEDLELVPFRRAIDAGVDMVMVGHLYFPALSDLPSSLSREIVTDLLRKKMGFEGVIIADALNMGALLNRYEMQEIFEMAFLAGCDLLLTAHHDPEVIENLIEKVIPEAIDRFNDIFPEKLIRESVDRIGIFQNT